MNIIILEIIPLYFYNGPSIDVTFCKRVKEFNVLVVVLFYFQHVLLYRYPAASTCPDVLA